MKNVIAAILALSLVIALVIYFGLSEKTNLDAKGLSSSGASSEESLPSGVSLEQFNDSASWFKTNYPEQPVTREAILLVLAERATKQSKPEVAVECYDAISTTTPKLGLVARLEQGKLLVALNQADQAEAALRAYLEAARVASELQPQQVQDAFKWLTYILSVEIRQEDRKQILMEQHQISLADPLDSKQLFFPNLLILNSPAGKKKIAAFLESDPKNLRLRIANARYRTLEGSYDEAIKLLAPLHQEYPNDLTVAAALSEAYFENADSASLKSLLAALPARSDREPWLLTRMRGESALENKQWQVALECFEQVLKNDATNATAQMGIAKSWAGLGEESKRQVALQRSAIIAEIRVNLSSVQPNAENACYDLAEKCAKLGLDLATESFKQHAKVIAQQNEKKN
ncbi:MAG: hypothetical protein U0930_03855 [Pirellulales bacterium]